MDLEEQYRNCIVRAVEQQQINFEDLLINGTSFDNLLEDYYEQYNELIRRYLDKMEDIEDEEEIPWDVMDAIEERLLEDLLEELDLDELEEFIKALDEKEILDANLIFECME